MMINRQAFFIGAKPVLRIFKIFCYFTASFLYIGSCVRHNDTVYHFPGLLQDFNAFSEHFYELQACCFSPVRFKPLSCAFGNVRTTFFADFNLMVVFA